jgi:hypothetical protein
MQPAAPPAAPMQPPAAPMQSAAAQPVTGGKYKSKRRYMKGGFTSGVPNAQPQVWVGKGGRRTRRRHNRKHRHTKSCKHYRKH